MLGRIFIRLKELAYVIWLFCRRSEEQRNGVLLILKAYEEKDKRELL